MTVLIASILALVAGPVIAWLAAGNHGFLDGIESFLLLSISGLVMLEILPYSFAEASWYGVGAAACGVILPIGLHQLFHNSPAESRRPSMVMTLAIIGLGIHAFLDGMGLGSHGAGSEHVGTSLTLAIVLHRLPMGLLLWWLIRPRFGFGWAAGAIAFVAIATIGGYASGAAALEGASSQMVAVVQGFVAGCLLHVLLHPRQGEHVGEHTVWSTWFICIGALLGIVLVAGMEFLHPSTHTTAASSMPMVMSALITLGAFIIARFEPVIEGQHAHHHAHGHED